MTDITDPTAPEAISGEIMDAVDLLPTADDADAPQLCQFRHPTAPGEPPLTFRGEPVGVMILGKDSKAFREAQRAAGNRLLRARKAGAVTAEDLERDALLALANAVTAYTEGLKGFLAARGMPTDCNKANTFALFRKFPWMREQADEFSADRANFVRASSSGS